MPSTASRRPVAVSAGGGANAAAAASRRRSEIFVDVVERLSAVLAADGRGGCEMTLRARLTFNPAMAPPGRSEFGPATLGFEIPMYSVSSLQVRYLRVAERQGGFNPFRWVRYVTQSNSYLCRF
ncbi:hypothetical protein Emag_003856 [Eimeria magna]